jgi:hypothetical protein
MRAPQVINADEFSKGWPVQISIGQQWYAARPMSDGGLLTRIRLARMVFWGEADALVWHDQ